MSASFLTLAQTGGLEGALTSSGNFYGGDQTQSMLLLSDGTYLEDQAVERTFIPGLRSIPRWIPIHRLIWRDYYRRADRH